MKSFDERINLNFPLEILSEEICKHYSLGSFVENKLIEIGYEDYNYILTTSKGKFVVKVFSNFRNDEDCLELTKRASIPHKFGFACPKVFEVDGENLYITAINGVKFRLLVMEFIDGENFFTLKELPNFNELKTIANEMVKLNQIDFRPNFIYDKWAIINFEKEYQQNIKYIEKNKDLIDEVYKEFKTIDLSKLKYGFVHGDIIETNVMKDKNGKLWFIDFSVSNYLPRIIDLAVTICDLCFDVTDVEKTKSRTKTFLEEYEKFSPLSEYEKDCLKIMLRAHQAITILETTREKIEENNQSEENLIFLEKGEIGLKMVFEYDFI